MELASILLVCCSAVLYLAAAVLYAYQLRTRTDKYTSVQNWVSGLGLLCQTALIGVMATNLSGTPLVGANILMLASWSIMVAYFIFEKITKRRSYGVFIVPIVLVAMVVSWELGAAIAPPEGNAVYKDWPLLIVHIVAYFVAASFFLLGGASAIMLLHEEKQIKSKKADVVDSRLPGLSFLKKVMRRSIVIGLPIFLLGILLGFVRATGMTDVSETWWLSPRILMSFVVLAICLVLLAQAYIAKTSANTMAKTHVVNAICVLTLTVFSAILPMLGS
jgi:HemX protein